MPATTFRPAPAQGLQLFGEGVDIALQYFNAGTKENLPSLTKLARAWAARYHGHHPPKVPVAANHDFFETFPHAFNLEIQAGIRLPPDEMVSPVGSHRELSRESSSALVTDEEVDNVVDLRTRRPHPSEARVKPEMRVNAGMLRCSGLLDRLPEFLDQLAKANTETEAELANNPGGSGFELGDEEAAHQPHISMNVYAGLMKPDRRRRHARGLALPADFDSADDGDQSSDAESVGSTSTFASAPPPSKKRKAMDDDDRSVSPALSTSSESSSSSGGPTRIIKIMVPESLRSKSQSGDSLSDASSTTGRKIIKLKSKPALSASAASSVPLTQPTKRRPSPRIVIKRRDSNSPADKTVGDDAQASDSSQRSQKKIRLVVRSSSGDVKRPPKRRSSKKL